MGVVSNPASGGVSCPVDVSGSARQAVREGAYLFGVDDIVGRVGAVARDARGGLFDLGLRVAHVCERLEFELGGKQSDRGKPEAEGRQIAVL